MVFIGFLLSFLHNASVFAQEGGPDTIIDGSKVYVTYIPGNMPLIISVPHGGYLLPDEIPERPCLNCAKNQDIFTIEIALRVREAIFQETGYYPYIIINNLHRTRLDPNRNIAEAADGNKNAEMAWYEFQNYIDSACSDVQKKYSKGLYIDLHGHRHDIKRTELGYLLSSDELQLEDDLLDLESFVEFSSIRNLVSNNINSFTYSQLVRGPKSLGSLLEKMGYPTVPSPENPAPGTGEPYFSGGYNTTRHGSSSGGTIDGIQIELDEDIRRDAIRRDKLASDLGRVLVDFLGVHYFPDGSFTEMNSIK